MSKSAGRQHVERWLRATRNVVKVPGEELFTSPDYGPDGPLASLATRLKVAPEFLLTWTQEKSFCAIRCKDQWFVVVDFGYVHTLLEMTPVIQLQKPDAAIAAILSREIAERFRSAGLFGEGILFAQSYRQLREEVARIYKEARGISESGSVLELYLAAHELAHVVFGEDLVFSGKMRAAVVDIVGKFVKSQEGAAADSRDPELARMPAAELAKVRAGVQAGWLAAIQNDEALQEELAADDLARAIVCHSRTPGPPLLTAVTLYLIQLNVFMLRNLDLLVCGYQGGDHQKIRNSEPLLRSEYAAVDLVHLMPASGAPINDLQQRLGEVGSMHKELFRKALYEHVIPRLSWLNPKPGSRKTAVPGATDDRRAMLDELLSV